MTATAKQQATMITSAVAFVPSIVIGFEWFWVKNGHNGKVVFKIVKRGYTIS